MDTYEQLFDALAEHHRETLRHSESVRDLTYMLAKSLDCSDDHAEAIAHAGRLHDIGKLYVPNAILEAPRKLTDDEWRVVHAHPYTGAQIARAMGCQEYICDWIAAHHERLDGTGYYGRVDVPREAMMIATTDIWDATGANRPYRKAYTPPSVRLDILRSESARIGPDIIDAFIALIGDQAHLTNHAPTNGTILAANVA
jgi:putative nucleotidyltransferase with HDIG domain